MTEILQSLTPLFGSVALLAIVIGGFVLMFSPAAGKKILKNTAAAVAIFVIARMFAGTFAAATKDAAARASFTEAAIAAAFCVLALAAVGAGFLYIFRPQLAQALLKRAAVAAALVVLLPLLAPVLVGHIGAVGVLVVLSVASAVAFVLREGRRTRSERRRTGSPERTPLLPRGEDRP